ncbi:MAG TPA: hypothetical protein PKW35_23680 [Nannocystaceae bacterium]|nr:hypothetical protein [Nannocystaceae bacterium]
MQWYLQEESESICHGLQQSVMKRGLPRRLMHDGGAAMKSEEFRSGLAALCVQSEETLPRSPEQNGKMEHFWHTLEGRLCAMLEGVPDLTLELLNEATQAWVECEYNRRVHSETGMTPLERLLQGPSVGRPCPDVEVLRRAFRAQRTRTLRRSDCTLSLDGVRFEVPSRFRTMREVTVRYARWDLRTVTMVDRATGVDLCPLHPLDRERNADGRRASLQPVTSEPPPPSGVAPLLKALMAEYAACGLPPAYAPLPARDEVSEETDEPIHEEEDDDDTESPC